jgi:hypothetical protein
VVVAVMPGVVYDVPVPNDVPSTEAVYQLTVPDDAVAPNITVPVPHRDAGVVVAIVGIALTVAVTAVLVAVVHPDAVAST